MFVLLRLIFILYIPTIWVNGQNNQRQVLVNLAKTLSDNLQATLTNTSQQLQGLANQDAALSTALKELEVRVLNGSSLAGGLESRVLDLEDRTLLLEDRRSMDLTIWNYNSLVCNASLQELRQQLEEKISKVSEKVAAKAGAGAGDPSKPAGGGSPANQQESKGALDLLSNLDRLLEDYQYYDTPTIPDPVAQTPAPGTARNSTGSLLEETNRLLTDINIKYKEVKKQTAALEKETESLKRKVGDPKGREEVRREIKEFKEDAGYRIAKLREDMTQDGAAIREILNMKVEDMNMYKSIIESSLNLFKEKIERVEGLTVNLTDSINLNMEQMLAKEEIQQTSTPSTLETPTRRTERPAPEYSLARELDNLEADILNTPGRPDTDGPFLSNLHKLKPQSLVGSQSSYRDYLLSLLPPTKQPILQPPLGGFQPLMVKGQQNQLDPAAAGQLYHQRQAVPGGPTSNWRQDHSALHGGYTGSPSLSSPPAPAAPRPADQPRDGSEEYRQRSTEEYRQRSTEEYRQRRRPVSDDYEDAEASNSCECSFMQERLNILESGFENMMTEVENQMSGIQVSITKMVHQLQDIEAKQAARSKSICVPSKGTAGLDGMDDWCIENCPSLACTPEICSCHS